MFKKAPTKIKRKKIFPKNKGATNAVSSAQATRTAAKAKTKKSAPTDSTHHKVAEEKLKSSHRLLDAIKNAQSKYITQPDSKQFFHDLLADTLNLTQSEFGFIGKVLFTDQGKPYLKTHTLTNIAWNKETRELYEKNAETGMEFHNMDTLFGTVITTGKAVISNDPSKDPRSGGIPKGHPQLKSFMGLPFYHGNKLIGMVAMANRPNDYSQELVEFLQPFLATCANLLQAWESTLEQKEVKSALQKSEERLNLALEATSDGVWDWNISTGHVFFSTQWFRSLGYEPGELEPHISSWEKLVHPDDMPKLREGLNAHLEGKTPVYQFENRLLTKTGIYRWNLDRGRVVSRDSNGKPLRMVGTDIDITKRKLIEQTLENKNQALHEILGQIEIEKKQIKDTVKSNIEDISLPLIKKLKDNDKGKYKLYDFLERSLAEVTSDFGIKILTNKKLSPREIEVCNMVRNGFETKEIASFLGIASATVISHRKRIRAKLGLKNNRINLTSFLRTT